MPQSRSETCSQWHLLNDLSQAYEHYTGCLLEGKGVLNGMAR